MKFFTLLAAFAAFAILPARAEETPPPPAGPGATAPAPAPAPTQPGATAPAPVANKPEEDGASMMARLKNAAAMLTNSQGITGKVQGLENDLSSLEKDLTTANATITRLTAELKEKTDLLAVFDAWLAEQGHTTAQEAAADPAKAFEKAVGSGVAATVRKIGVPAAAITTKLNDQAPQSLEDIQAQLAACKTPAERQALLAANKKLILASN